MHALILYSVRLYLSDWRRSSAEYSEKETIVSVLQCLVLLIPRFSDSKRLPRHGPDVTVFWKLPPELLPRVQRHRPVGFIGPVQAVCIMASVPCGRHDVLEEVPVEEEEHRDVVLNSLKSFVVLTEASAYNIQVVSDVVP